MAANKQSPSSSKWHSGHGKRKKDLRVQRSSHGKFASVEALEVHRKSVNPNSIPKKKSLA